MANKPKSPKPTKPVKKPKPPITEDDDIVGGRPGDRNGG